MELKDVKNGLEGFSHFSAPVDKKKLKTAFGKELNETDELKEGCLKQLRTLIEEHNVACITTDEFLLRFLRSRKYDIQRTFECVRNYAKQRVAMHKLLMEVKPQALQMILRHNFIGFCPYRDAQERIIFFHKTGIWNPSVCSSDLLFVVFIPLLFDYAAEKESLQTAGVITIHDAECLPVSYLNLLSYAKDMSKFFFHCLPARHEEHHVINEPSLLHYILQILNPLLPEKIKKRIFLHGKGRDVLFQHIDSRILPDVFGGSLGPLNNEDYFIEEITEHLQKMKNDQHYFLGNNLRQ